MKFKRNLLYLADQMGAIFGEGYLKIYDRRITRKMNSQITSGDDWHEVKRWAANAKSLLF